MPRDDKLCHNQYLWDALVSEGRNNRNWNPAALLGLTLRAPDSKCLPTCTARTAALTWLAGDPGAHLDTGLSLRVRRGRPLRYLLAGQVTPAPGAM